MTEDEARDAFGSGWYISPTGDRAETMPADAMPVTPRQYSDACEGALYWRGVAARRRRAIQRVAVAG